MEAIIHTVKNKSFWVYLGNFIGILSVFSVIGALGTIQNLSFSNPICGVLEWWVSSNYILLSIAQILGVVGFVLLLIPSARASGVACWVGIVLLYLAPVEIGHNASCWSVNNNQGDMTGQETTTQPPNQTTADNLLESPENPLKTP